MNDDVYTAVVSTVLIKLFNSLEQVIQGTRAYTRSPKGRHVKCLHFE